MKNILKQLSDTAIDRIVEMAWEDRTSFDAIQRQFGIAESQVIKIMRREMTSKNFKKWRARVQNRKTKHQQVRQDAISRFKCSRQRQISNNRVSKR